MNRGLDMGGRLPAVQSRPPLTAISNQLIDRAAIGCWARSILVARVSRRAIGCSLS
jgi:hypothetical protein